jgi:hypothetical protein
VSVIEPSDAVNAGMVIHSLISFVGWLVWILRISLTVVLLALCKGVVMLYRFGVRCSGLQREHRSEFTVRDSALGR